MGVARMGNVNSRHYGQRRKHGKHHDEGDLGAGYDSLGLRTANSRARGDWLPLFKLEPIPKVGLYKIAHSANGAAAVPSPRTGGSTAIAPRTAAPARAARRRDRRGPLQDADAVHTALYRAPPSGIELVS